MIRGKSAKRKSTTVLLEGSKKRCSSLQQTASSHFKPLQDATTNSISSSKRRYIEVTPWEESGKIRPELPTPPFSEGSPSKPSAIPIPTIPLPHLNFAPNDKVWAGLKRQEERRHNGKLGILNHPTYGQCNRAKLLDWLVEVCQHHRLKRETYYLAMDYTDRFYSKRADVKWEQCQLVGVTALHMAAKLEEIYPPGCENFAEMTAGACSKEDIWEMELSIMKVLDWRLSSLTVNTWLNLFLQINHFRGMSCTTLEFMKPEYSQGEFVKIIQLVDLCALDSASVRFRPSVIAASALWLILPYQLQEVTGYAWEDLIACRNWMQPYAQTLQGYPSQTLKSFSGIEKKDRHNIQTHFAGLTLLAEVWKAQEDEPLTPDSGSDVENEEVTRYMSTPSSSTTPPSSSHR